MDKISPMLHSLMLRDGINTAHADLGFRLAVPIEESTLFEKARGYLNISQRRLWTSGAAGNVCPISVDGGQVGDPRRLV
jgi:hypothetical protein